MWKILSFAALLSVLGSSLEVPTVSDAEWAAFKARFKKTYASEAEDSARRDILASNLRLARVAAAAQPTATFGATKFSDLTPKEFNDRRAFNVAPMQKSVRLAKKVTDGARVPGASAFRPSNATIPQAVDWRNKTGVVSPVKDQGYCGSCWAFAATENIESMWAIAGHRPSVLGPQYLESCDDFFAFKNCNLGSTSLTAFMWLTKHRSGLMPTEKSYPYVDGEGGAVPKCDPSNRQWTAQVVGAQLLPLFNPEAMMEFVALHGPTTVLINAADVHYYTGGIMTQCRKWMVDHEVVVVGYGTGTAAESNLPYWIVRNSWGADWGEEGYFRVERNKNLCNIELMPASAVVNATRF